MFSPSELSPAQADALRRAEPVPEDPTRLRLPSDIPTGIVLGLLRLTLVAQDDQERRWLITPKGRAEHVRLGGTAVERRAEGSLVRATMEPGSGPEEIRALQRALDQVRKQEPPLPWTPGPFAGGWTGQVALAAMGIVFTLVLIVAEPEPGSAVVFALFFAVLLALVYFRHRRAHTRALAWAEQHPRNVIDRNQGRYVSETMLDEQATDMLGRVQRAVDTVLGSTPHHEGLLLDRTRNRVVLADTEWGLARELLRHTHGRERLEGAPAVGERSQQAAERARAALDTDGARVESRIRTLEAYAARVREVEREVQDRALAAEFDALADHAALAAAAGPHQEESLTALIQAQELALEVAAFDSTEGAVEDEVPGNEGHAR